MSKDVFRQPWKPFKLDEEERETPLGYAEHVKGRVARPQHVRLRPRSARPQTDPTKCSKHMRIQAALGSQEATFKVVSYGRDLDSVKRQLRYIGRDGDVALERSFGEVIEGDRDAIDQVAEEWSTAFSERKGGARNSIHMLVSAPAGSDRDAVEDAAREFAAQTFGGNWDYVMARHDDTNNPHVHIVAEARGLDGNRFTVEPEDIQPMRERFAEACREEGLDLTATPRAVRAVSTERSEPIGIVKLREEGAVPERDVRPQAEADAQRERSAEEKLIAHEAKINRALAAELRETGDVKDARAAKGLEGLASRADAFLDRDAGESDEAAQGDAPQTEEETPADQHDSDDRKVEPTDLEQLIALERLTALRKRKYDQLRAQLPDMPSGTKGDAIDSLRDYERDLNDANAKIEVLRGSIQEPPGTPEQAREDDPSEKHPPARQERDADREEDDRDDDDDR